ncbi:MAG TPA: ABC transporter permease, partial [Candidatus Saccharimonadales bacterium]|nr:ABC transporter permease [Candidatus Saccharimonadales bacterium]
MKAGELARLSIGAVRSHRLRSFLTALGIGVGVTAVVLLTSIGEGIHRYVLSEFTQFGTNLIGINPGKTTTFGVSGALLGTIRPLSMQDAESLNRVPWVEELVPIVQGNAEVEASGLKRRANIIGTGPSMPDVFTFGVATGRFLPADDTEAPRAYVVLGSKVYKELFAESNPLGARVRIGGERFRVIGVMESKGQILGFDLNDAVYIPVARALDMFDREGLMEIDVLYGAGAPVDQVVAGIKRTLIARHGQEDFTVTTQQQMLDVLGSILDVLTFAVGALGGISLLVGGVGILTIMTIAVTERTSEIGLLRALGAERWQVLSIFLAEAVTLAALGGGAGLLGGVGIVRLIHVLVPGLPVHTPWEFAVIAE